MGPAGPRLVLALAVALGACAKKPPVVLGARMPAGCHGDGTSSERCVGWLLDRLLMTVALTPYRDAEIDAYVARVGQRLVAASGDRRTWTFRVLDNPEIQAFAGISTTVYINRGALAPLRDEAELAGVLGHEIGHVLGGHSHEMFEELAKDLASSSLTEAEKIQSARDDEIQADETAVVLAAKAGYDPHGVERMLRAYAATDTRDREDPSDHHPPWVERVARIQALAAAYPAGGERGEAAYHAHVARLVVGPDPRAVALVGGAAVFANLGVAVELPALPAAKLDGGSIGLELDAVNAVDLRVVSADFAKVFPTKPDADGVLSQIVVRGGNALLITAKGPLAHELARALHAAVRAPRATELAQIAPKRVDLDAPRFLWLPPTE